MHWLPAIFSKASPMITLASTARQHESVRYDEDNNHDSLHAETLRCCAPIFSEANVDRLFVPNRWWNGLYRTYLGKQKRWCENTAVSLHWLVSLPLSGVWFDWMIKHGLFNTPIRDPFWALGTQGHYESVIQFLEKCWCSLSPLPMRCV